MKELKVYTNKPFCDEIYTMKFKVRWVALAEITPAWKSDIMAWPATRCYCVDSGRAVLHLEDRDIEMTAGNIYIIPSGLPCGYSCDGEMFKLFSHFIMTRFETQDVFSKIKQCIVLENKRAVIDEMMEACKKADFVGATTVYSLLYQTAVEAIKMSGLNSKDFPEYSGVVKRAISLIDENCRINLNAEELAEKMNMSAVNLQRLFKKEVGIPLGQYVRERVMQSVAFDLKSTSKTIGEISERYGFSDQFYFAKVFKKHYNIQPSAYRK